MIRSPCRLTEALQAGQAKIFNSSSLIMANLLQLFDRLELLEHFSLEPSLDGKDKPRKKRRAIEEKIVEERKGKGLFAWNEKFEEEDKTGFADPEAA